MTSELKVYKINLSLKVGFTIIYSTILKQVFQMHKVANCTFCCTLWTGEVHLSTTCGKSIQNKLELKSGFYNHILNNLETSFSNAQSGKLYFLLYLVNRRSTSFHHLWPHASITSNTAIHKFQAFTLGVSHTCQPASIYSTSKGNKHKIERLPN